MSGAGCTRRCRGAARYGRDSQEYRAGGGASLINVGPGMNGRTNHDVYVRRRPEAVEKGGLSVTGSLIVVRNPSPAWLCDFVTHLTFLSMGGLWERTPMDSQC